MIEVLILTTMTLPNPDQAYETSNYNFVFKLHLFHPNTIRDKNEASQYIDANHQNFALHNFTEEQKDNFYIDFLQLIAFLNCKRKLTVFCVPCHFKLTSQVTLIAS
jgi:hypothetical protein